MKPDYSKSKFVDYGFNKYEIGMMQEYGPEFMSNTLRVLEDQCLSVKDPNWIKWDIEKKFPELVHGKRITLTGRMQLLCKCCGEPLALDLRDVIADTNESNGSEKC